MFETFLFGVFPYLVLILMIAGLIWRYVTNQFGFSSLSSQFLENRQLFWGSVPWHYGIILILLGHLTGILFPKAITVFIDVPVRLVILESTGLALSMMLFAGLLVLIVRRSSNANIRKTTTPMDVALLVVLLFQVVTGIITAVFYRWGSAWYVQTAAPYFASIFTLSPKIEYMTILPLFTKLHAVNAFLIVGLFPFTRLVHMLPVPFAYLWRPYQKVIWYRRQKTIKTRTNG